MAKAMMCPEAEEFFSEKQIAQMQESGVMERFIEALKSPEGHYQMPESSAEDNKAIHYAVLSYLHIVKLGEFVTAAAYIKKYPRELTPKQRNFIIEKHPMLQKIEHAELLFASRKLISGVLRGSYNEVVPVLPQLIEEKFSEDVARAYAMIQLGQYASAILEEEEYYIFFLKAEIEYFLTQGEREQFLEKWNELNQALPDDEDLAALMKVFEEQK